MADLGARSDLLPASEVPVAMIDLDTVAAEEPLGAASCQLAEPVVRGVEAITAAPETMLSLTSESAREEAVPDEAESAREVEAFGASSRTRSPSGPRAAEECREAEAGRETKPSFEQLYVASYQPLVRLAFVLTGSIELSEDLVQDCFVRLHRHYDRLETPERYAKQAVVNACRSHFRAAGRERNRRPLLYVIDDGDVTCSSGAISGELNDVLLALPYRQRAAIVLRYFSGLSELEIAEVLGCRPGTVGSLIHRALERLRRAIEP